ncbi:hypothetical protein [Methylorubrum zatmanii]|uniref:Phosphatidate cytidylyltransferase n=1 Tax=Methylorubrum zatmanii TaxID=29429 RepID=A0ABW1WMY2_9HYPH|nr:hypothetical protein [Methylorubrum zatmanii]
MTRAEELALLAVLGGLTLLGALLWAREGLVLWFRAGFGFC